MTNDSHRLTAPSPSASASATERQPIWKHGVAAAVGAAVATTVLAAIASAAGVSFSDGEGGQSIPIPMFTILTLLFSLAGLGIAAIMARKARRPRTTFVRTTIALLVVSFIPSILTGLTAGSIATLIALHIVAAAIVVPTLAGRLAPTR